MRNATIWGIIGIILLLCTSVLFTQKHLHTSDCNEVHNTRIATWKITFLPLQLSYAWVRTNCHPIPASLTVGAAPHHRVAPRYDMSITPYQIPLHGTRPLSSRFWHWFWYRVKGSQLPLCPSVMIWQLYSLLGYQYCQWHHMSRSSPGLSLKI